MRRSNKSARRLLNLARVLHGIATVGIFLCIMAVFYLCTRPWWDFRTDIKPLFTGEAVAPLLFTPAAFWVVYLLKTAKANGGWVDDLICFGAGIWFCVPIADRYVHLAEFMLFGPGGVDLKFSADAAMPAYWMTLNVAIAAVVIVVVRSVFRIVYPRVKGVYIVGS